MAIEQPVQAQDRDKARRAELFIQARRMKSGGNTFYWIAALSAVNTLVSIFGGGIYFVIGLGVTLFVDVVASGISQQMGGSPVILGIGFAISLIFDALFAAFGYFASKGHRWAFLTGMGIYVLDAVLTLVFQDWVAFAFHIYFLWLLWNGLQALARLKALSPQVGGDMAFPQDIGVA
jgi:hypothetical protein